ncbi:MAG: DUF2274 domain-containing protein [Pseudomonadota bacterium]
MSQTDNTTLKKPSLRIARLPDLTPVKMTVHFEPETHRMLEDYATLYAQSYGEAITPVALVPTMIATFLASDAWFKRARKTLPNSSS